MGASVYITDPAVAEAYHVAQGQWVYVEDDAEAAWLVANRHAYTLHRPEALPEPPYVNPDAPLPFVPYGEGTVEPPPPPAARRKLTRRASADESDEA